MGIKTINITATTISPLYTGEVREEDKKASKVNFPVRKTASGRVIIPFKGPLRGTLEKLLKSKGEQVCDTGQSRARPCGRCLLCSIFGSMGKKGRATVDFLMSEGDAKQIVRQASHNRIDRNKGSVSDAYTGEEVIENSVFKADIIIHDYQDNDLQLLKNALKEIETEGIGGWVNKGYGRVKFDVKEQ